MNKKFLLILTLLVFLVVSVAVAVDNADVDNLTVGNNSSSHDKILSSDDSKDSSDADKLISVPQNTDKLKDYPIESFTIKKVWDDNNNASGKRPSSVKVIYSIRGDGQEEIELTEDEGWTKTIREVIDSADDVRFIGEVSVPGYTTKITGNPEDGFTITNTIIDESKDNSTNDNSTKDNSTKKNTDKDTSDNTKDTTKNTTKTVTKVDKKPKKPVKDKYKTGHPILLALLAISGAGLVVQLRRKE